MMDSLCGLPELQLLLLLESVHTTPFTRPFISLYTFNYPIFIFLHPVPNSTITPPLPCVLSFHFSLSSSFSFSHSFRETIDEGYDIIIVCYFLTLALTFLEFLSRSCVCCRSYQVFVSFSWFRNATSFLFIITTKRSGKRVGASVS